MLFRQRHNGIHLTGHARIMYRHNRFGPVGDRRFNQALINIHGVWTYIDKHNGRPAQHEGIGG
ncbi:hypothetical protein D3C71_2212570 [compost metagenome]